MNCPNCGAPTVTAGFAGNYGKAVTLDLCHGCQGIWFDRYENLQLTPDATLQLFTLIHEKRGAQHNPLAQVKQCPRCRARLVPTHDMQRATRFSYDRCPREHGRFITFFQFLREKNFVRPLSSKEIEELKRRIKMLHCSNCGAAVDLEKDAACPYCRAAISMLDPQQVEKTVRELQATASRRPPSAPDLLRERLQFDQLSPGDASDLGGSFVDLVTSGLDVVVSWAGDS